MEKSAKERRDVFNADLLQGAILCGRYGFPLLRKSLSVPKAGSLVSFPKRRQAPRSSWVHFYTDDYRFAGLWRNPHRYLEELRSFAGVITPDFSAYSDAPLAQQIWSVFQGRAIGHWLQKNGVKVIPNLRWGDERTHSFAFDGIAQGGTVAVGTHGCIKRREDRETFMCGFGAMLDRVRPKTIVLYGKPPDGFMAAASKMNATVKQHDSEFHMAHNQS